MEKQRGLQYALSRERQVWRHGVRSVRYRSGRCERRCDQADDRGDLQKYQSVGCQTARFMKFASLGSGSEGNALLIAAGTKSFCSGTRQTLVLMDCGFGLKDTLLRLARLGVSAEQLSGIVVTHEHGDHSGGVARLGRHIQPPGWVFPRPMRRPPP